MIFGDYAGDQTLAAALGLPRPGPGEFVSARLTRRGDRNAGVWPAPGGRRTVRLDGADWALAEPSDPPMPGPRLPRSRHGNQGVSWSPG